MNALFSKRMPLSPLALLAVALLFSSCSIPPSEAWRNFTTKVASVFDASRPAELKNDAASSRGQIAASRYQMIASQPKIASSTAAGILIPGRPGFVRTPFTTPGRLVDVRDFTTGTEVRCPYTQNVFLVPDPAAANLPASTTPQTPSLLARNSHTTRKIAANARPSSPKPTVTLASQDSIPKTITPSPARSYTKPDSSQTVDLLEAAASSPSSRPTSPTRNLAASTPSNPDKAPETSPKSSSPSSAEAPYGAPVHGRPGFVNSPFAAKHQLVDVSGLPRGTEVKCPYSGKLFRVPSADTTTLPAEATAGADPSSTDPAGDSLDSNVSPDAAPTPDGPSDPSPATPESEGSGDDVTSTPSLPEKISLTAGLDHAKLTSTSTASHIAARNTEPSDIPTALHAPGKVGFVLSPHDDGKLVDIRGTAPGSQIRCPFSGKLFAVPN